MPSTSPSIEQYARNTLEAFGLYTETSVHILRQLADFTARAAKEGVSLGANLQASAQEAVQVGQSALLWPLSVSPQSPAGTSQEHLRELTQQAAHLCQLLQSNTQTVLRAMEQCWNAGQQTSNDIQTSYAHLMDRLHTLYAAAAEQTP